MIRAGELKNRVVLQQPTVTADSVGDLIQSWTTTGTYWAKIEPASGTERMIAGQIKAEVSHKLTMRYLGSGVPVLPTSRFLVNTTRVFHVVSVLDEENRHRMLTIYCLEKTS